MDLMKDLPDKYIDLAIVDPPYGIGVGSMPYTNGVAMVGKALAKRRDYSSNSDWDTSPPLRNTLMNFSGCQKIKLYGAVIISPINYHQQKVG